MPKAINTNLRVCLRIFLIMLEFLFKSLTYYGRKISNPFMIGANEMRTNMVIPDPILELIKFRVAQSHKYRAILGAEMYSIDKALEAGLLDEIVSPDDLAKTVNEKAKDLATMGHPSYTMTKELFIAEPLKKINQAIVDLHSNS